MKKLISGVMAMIVMSANAAPSPESDKLAQFNKRIDAVEISAESAPLIGVTPTGSTPTSVSKPYIDAVLRAGGVPVVIAANPSAEYLAQVVTQLDGVLLTGGEDIDPEYFGEKAIEQLGAVDDVRDEVELAVLRLAANRNIPVFGICRGCQVINVGFGGTLYQDFPSQRGQQVTHQRVDGERSRHMVTIDKDNILYKILGKSEIEVNSSHHQSVREVAPGFKVGAYSPDSIVESVDMYPAKRILGVQWHPEGFDGKNEDMNRLLEFFVGEARLYKTAKAMHGKMLSIDTHTDAPLEFEDGVQLGVRSGNRVNVPLMRDGMLDSQFLAIFVSSDIKVKRGENTVREPRPLCLDTYEESNRRMEQLFDSITAQVKRYEAVCGIAETQADAQRLKREGKKAFFLGVENGLCLGEDLSRIAQYRHRGIRYITLTHTYDNQLCHSSTHTADASKGLTKLGKKAVKEMNRLGILVDLSHASEGTFWDVMKLSKYPVFCSHSGAKALCDNDRNLTDEQLRALAAQGGVVQTVAYAGFLRNDKQNATIDDFVRHIKYMVDVAGIDHVGIGTDFDGGGGVPGFETDADAVNVTMKLIEAGFSEDDIAKLWGENFFRVLGEADKAGQKK